MSRIGPKFAELRAQNRAAFIPFITAGDPDREALDAFKLCAKLEGILPALEPAHALAHVTRIAPRLPRDHLLVVNICGRGDKDVFTVANTLGVKL